MHRIFTLSFYANPAMRVEKLMKHFALLGPILTVSLSVTSSALASDKPPQRDALTTYSDCTLDAALRLDDFRSDAATIARAIQSNCAIEFEIWKNETAAYMTSVDDRHSVSKSLERDQDNLLISMVLKVRKARDDLIAAESTKQHQ
ncbi:hypothetical protein [Phenylobacterium sp.]|jgi:hypothetical protein|uniref:hypothetical protein n=1 Tax=Phenylobacterium sp. TaxID=1871053 RepID=UPI002F3FFFF6